MYAFKTVALAALATYLLAGCAADKQPPAETDPGTKAAPTAMAMTKANAIKPGNRKAAPAKPQAKTERGFVIHSRASAPAESREGLDFGIKNFGFVSNLAGVMSESPALWDSYYRLQLNLQRIGSLTPPEDNIVQMSIAMENKCQYCVAGHTLAGKVFFKSPAAQLEAIRRNARLPQAKFNALRDFSVQVYSKQGRVTAKELRTFLDAGYTRRQALDVVANVAAKVMSNYTNQLARTPLDDQIKPMAKGLPFAEDRKKLPIE